MPSSVTRRAALGGAFGGAFAIRAARAAEFAFKIATDVPETAPINVYLRKAIEAIGRESDGRVQFTLYPNNQLGDDPAMFSQLRSGALECFMLSGVNSLSQLIPKASIYGLGFAFKDDSQVYAALDGALGAALRQQIRAANLIVLDRIWANGFRQVTSSTKPIREVHDLDGFKIRTPVSALWVSTFRALGASPTALPFSDVYSALQTHVVDGQETPLALISADKLYEVQKYCALTDHMWDGWWCLFGPAAWKRLPDPMKQIVMRNIDAAALEQRTATAQENDALKTTLAGQGLAFNGVDRVAFQAKLRAAGYYARWRAVYGDQLWALLEQYTGRLA